MKCPNCNTENPVDYAFCLSCGGQLEPSAQDQPAIKAVANVQLEKQLDRKRKQAVTALAKLYTAIAKKMRLPQLLTFDANNPSLQPEAVVRSIDTPVLEKMELMKKLNLIPQKPFMLQLILLVAIFVITIVGVIISFEDYDVFMFCLCCLLPFDVVLIFWACLLSSCNRTLPYITAEIARRAQPDETKEETTCQN